MPLKPVTFNEKDLKKIFRTETPAGRFWRQLKRALKNVFYFVLLFGIFFMAINYSAFAKRAQYSVQSPAPITIPPPEPTPTITYAPEILIPKIGLEAPVIYSSSYANLLDNLRDGVVRYEGTANPGQIGNIVLLGHSSDFPWSTGHYKTVFALLDHLAVGDQIVLPFQTNRYVYEVTEKKVVKANNLSVLNRTDSPTLTLITCYPVGTSLNRLIIVATLKQGTPTTAQTTEPYLGTKLTTAR